MAKKSKKLASPNIEPKPELVFALVSRMGSQLAQTVSLIKGASARYDFEALEIHATKLLTYLGGDYEYDESSTLIRYQSLIAACNEARKATDRKDILALLSANTIRNNRQKRQKSKYRGTIYILNQMKKPEEIRTLREIYGEALVVISCHSPYERRLRELANKIALDDGRQDFESSYTESAKELIERDERENDPFGQDVGSAFPLADYILDISNSDDAQAGINRLFRLLFGDPRLSPTFEEYANNLASQAAYRSTDLSRQVGAAVFSEDRRILSLGCNEVPKSGGGTYWIDHHADSRDAAIGFDANTIEKRNLVIDVIKRLQGRGVLKKKWDSLENEELAKTLLDDDKYGLSEAEILSILEYGRALHAEMNALMDVARSNDSVQEGMMFVTTFPCHNCAKHIVGSGVRQVTYLEPYPKSKVSELYPDSIEVDPERKHRREHKVTFRQFCGVTKRKFHLFAKSKLKDSKGTLLQWSESTAKTTLRVYPADFENYEKSALIPLQDFL